MDGVLQPGTLVEQLYRLQLVQQCTVLGQQLVSLEYWQKPTICVHTLTWCV